MNVDKDRRINHQIGSGVECVIPQFIAQFRPPFDRTKDEDPFKVERNKIAARIAISYTNQAWIDLEQDAAYKVITEYEPSEEIDEDFYIKTSAFYKSMYKVLNSAVENELKRRGNLPIDTQERRELEKLQSLPPFVTDGNDKLSKIKEFFTLGNGTGVTAIANLIGVIPSVYFNQYGKEISKSELLQIARNSYPMIDQFTQLHLDDFSRLEYGLYTDGNKKAKKNDPRHFFIEDSALGVREESVRSIFQPPDSDTPLHAHTSVRTGCITRFERIDNGEGNQMLAKDFFDRFLNVVEKL